MEKDGYHICSVFIGNTSVDLYGYNQEIEWACRAFSFYVLHGRFEEHTVRHPTRGMFNKIFKEDDKALKNYLKSIKSREEMGIHDLFEEWYV